MGAAVKKVKVASVAPSAHAARTPPALPPSRHAPPHLFYARFALCSAHWRTYHARHWRFAWRMQKNTHLVLALTCLRRRGKLLH